MKTEAQISRCTIALRVRNRTWGWGGGGRRERWRDKLCANRSYDLGQRYEYWFRTLSLLGISDWGVTPYFRPENVILHTLFQTYPASRGFSLAWLLSITKSFASLVSLVVGLSQERRTKQNNYATDGERFRKRWQPYTKETLVLSSKIHICFQTWRRIRTPTKRFLKIHFEFASLLFLSYSFETERTNAFTHSNSSLETAGGTKRLFSVKYLFGEANIVQNFLLFKGGYKFLDDRSIHVQFSTPI